MSHIEYMCNCFKKLTYSEMNIVIYWLIAVATITFNKQNDVTTKRGRLLLYTKMAIKPL